MAVLLLSVIALGLTDTLIAAQRARVVSAHWMQATELAAEGIEQLRAGRQLAAVRGAFGFERSGSAGLWHGHAGLYRLEVTVSWKDSQDSQPRTFRLVTLARR